MSTVLSESLWSDLKTDEERANWLLLGRGYETGVIAKALQNDVAMAFHYRAQMMAHDPHAAQHDYKAICEQFVAWLNEGRTIAARSFGGVVLHDGHISGLAIDTVNPTTQHQETVRLLEEAYQRITGYGHDEKGLRSRVRAHLTAIKRPADHEHSRPLS